MDVVNIIFVPTHTLLVDDEIEIVGVTFGVMVILMALDNITVLVLQVALLVNSQVITSPLFMVVVLNVDELVPALEPFTFHWNDGVVPPLLMVAVNRALIPAQRLLFEMLIDMVGVTFGFTVIPIAFE